jgi:hypothetical protein
VFVGGSGLGRGVGDGSEVAVGRGAEVAGIWARAAAVGDGSGEVSRAWAGGEGAGDDTGAA